MNQTSKFRLIMPALALALSLTISSTACAVPILIGSLWHEFSFTSVGVDARGCRPADPVGSPCIPSSAGNSVFVGAPAWTFFAGDRVLLSVTDAFLHGDQFAIFDFGALIGNTPVVAPGGTCGSDPVVCFNDPLSSHALLGLGAGAHSITIQPLNVSVFGGGAAYFRILVPEPAPLPLLLAGVGLLLCFGRRLSRAGYRHG